MWAVVYADSGQVVALRRTEAEARRVAETRKAGAELGVRKQDDAARRGAARHGRARLGEAWRGEASEEPDSAAGH